jgi:PAS domain S-box-containing protein
MQKPSDPRRDVLTGLLGLGSQSSRKSYYPELVARLEELEAERNRYKWLFENAVHGIMQASLDRGLLAANLSMARMLGFDSPGSAVIAYADSPARLFLGGIAEYQQIRTVLLRDGELSGYETQLLRADGRTLCVRMNMMLRPDTNEPVMEAFVADVTERREAQQALQRINEALEQRVLARTQELEALNENLRHQIVERERVEHALREARDAAEQANLSKDRYLAAASHDLLQPLNAARLLMATLRERNLAHPEAQLVERSHLALEAAEDMLSDLLDIARLDQSSVRAEVGDYRLAEIAMPLVEEFRGAAELAGLRLRAKLGGWAVRTDYRLLSRILRNLLSNAIRYTETGGVLIGCRRRGNQLSIEVWDSGRGIPAEHFRAIFHEFNQLPQATPGRRKGVGLGLAIVDRIALLLGARVSVRSVVGRGSVFSVSVPLASSRPAPPQASAALIGQLAEPLAGQCLLVVDNEEIILSSMEGLLRQWGAEVIVAAGGEQAIAALGERVPNAVLVDYHLDGGETGDAVVTRLREYLGHEVPAIMITADRSEHCQSALRVLGMPVLNKPVKPGKLRAVLAQMLRA